MTTIKIKYSELRAVTESIIDFVGQEYWWEKNSSLKTEIETDLGITGDDAWELMQKFSKKYSVCLVSFNFNQYFTPEGAHSSLILLLPVYLFLLVIWLIKVAFAFLIYPFSNRLAKYSMKSMINKTADLCDYPKLESITIADLITSAICRKFIKRDTVRFELK